MIIAKYLWIIGSLVITILSTLHLLYTFFTNKFLPRNEKVKDAMQATTPVLTNRTTMWRCWIGFNASHSSGAMFIGITNIYLAINYFSLFQSDYFFFLFNILTMAFYLWLGKKYWFKTPFTGIFISLACFIVSFILTIVNK